jgi:hypothetical protein
MKDSHFTAEKKSRQGLCTFCDVAPDCALIEASGMPVLECEEFRATVPPQGRAPQENSARDAEPTEVPLSRRKSHADWSEKGLCGNCAIYETCPFSKAEGGVWHCEEYR